MKTKLYFTIELEFDENFEMTNENILEVGNNIMDGLVNQVDNLGLAPEDSDTFTKSIVIYTGLGVVGSRLTSKTFI